MDKFINKVIMGDCLEKLKELPDNSVDSIVTDPPYELGFMGKSWDNTGIANNVEMWKECLRVLKPGGHLLAFSGTRTYHRMAVAIEDAGFEVRDMIEWVYSTGFPKSLNIGKSIESKIKTGSCAKNNFHKLDGERRGGRIGMYDTVEEQGFRKNNPDQLGAFDLQATTDEAKQWEGWGTALKPAHEPICMARKPLSEKTVAENCLKWGTGGINVDESRVEGKLEGDPNRFAKTDGGSFNKFSYAEPVVRSEGRFPANLIHDNSEEVRDCFPETNPSRKAMRGARPKSPAMVGDRDYVEMSNEPRGIDDNGGNASRFFKSIIYYPKASKSERNRGCENIELKGIGVKGNGLGRVCEFCGASQLKPEECLCEVKSWINPPKNGNNHPTVKPIALMEYLIKMVTPKGGIVLDPFAGSGSTLVAAKQNGYQYIGIELTEEYIPIIEARLK